VCTNIASCISWNATTVDDYAQNDKAKNRSDFDNAENELGLAIATHSKEIYSNNDDQENGDPSGTISVATSRPEFKG
jgi:hypothetical protein